MHLYHLTLERQGAIVAAVYGSFTAPKTHEIAVATSSHLEVWAPTHDGRLTVALASPHLFATVRSIATVRLPGSKKDYVVLGTDSGNLSILEVNDQSGKWVRVHAEVFGKTGVRRIVPGQYLAADPRGRAIMVAAVEKQKFVYVINRESEQEKMTVASPLEAHKAALIVHAVVGLDVGFENPVFAALERPYVSAAPSANATMTQPATQYKMWLALYELDLGLNHVTRKVVASVQVTANLLVPVPGGGDGPSGLLVCSEGKVSYFSASEDAKPLVAALPARKGALSTETVLVVCSATHKEKGIFFFLLCTELGDLIKVELSWTPGAETQVSELKLIYFDTIPGPAVSICVTKKGFLFVASEFGEHLYYQFQGIGEEDPRVGGISSSKQQPAPQLFFTPREEPVNLWALSSVDSLSPLTSWTAGHIGKAHQEAQQIVSLSGRGPKSTVRTLERGFSLLEMARSPLGRGTPVAIFTLRARAADLHHSMLVVSFANATLILRVGEVVQEIEDNGFVLGTTTYATGLLGRDAHVQIHPKGLLLVQADKSTSTWEPQIDGDILVGGATNQTQVAVASSNGDLIYFEMDVESGALSEVSKVTKQDLTAQDTLKKPAIAISPSSPNTLRGDFLAFSDGVSKIVRLFSIGRDGELLSVGVQSVGDPVNSLQFLDSDFSPANLHLLVGTIAGTLVRVKVDRVTGQLADRRSRFLGVKPVSLAHIRISGVSGCLALSSTPWVVHPRGDGELHASPLISKAIEHGSEFVSNQDPDSEGPIEGFVAVSGTDLRIVTFDDPNCLPSAAADKTGRGTMFSASVSPIKYTPRRVSVIDREKGLIVVASADQRMEVIPDTTAVGLAQKVGPNRAAVGQWASCIAIIDVRDPFSLEDSGDGDEEGDSHTVLSRIDLADSECVQGLCTMRFHDRAKDLFVCVGVTSDLIIDATSPKDFSHPRPLDKSRSEIRVYRYIPENNTMELVHTTSIDNRPVAVMEFHGRLLVGSGRSVAMYEMGRKRLLKKAENRRAVPHRICGLQIMGDRLFACDVQEGVHLLMFSTRQNQFILLGNETVPRWVTSTTLLDYSTVAGGDKFGNFFVTRLPPGAIGATDDDPTSGCSREGSKVLDYHFEAVCNFHVGSLIQTISKMSLGGTDEAIVYGTLCGAIGAFAPMATQSEVSFLEQLTLQLRERDLSLCSRDHLSYRSAYFPVRHVIDGDFCELFLSLPHDDQKKIAEELGREVKEISRKIEDMRDRIA